MMVVAGPADPAQLLSAQSNSRSGQFHSPGIPPKYHRRAWTPGSFAGYTFRVPGLNRRRLSHLLQRSSKRIDSMVNLLLGDDQRRLEAQDIAEGSAQAYQDAIV